ncbi:MAG: hypothetical protein RIR26_1293 [Pseudomonadota bacterium]|jgi:acyl-CoA reductase-like NAD-dependent aldehyde dehydrogenase
MNAEHSVDSSKLQVAAEKLKQGFQSGRTRTLASRLRLLSALEALIQDNQELMCKAIADDLGRPADDTYIAELSVILEEIHTAKRCLKSWMKPKSKWMPLVLFPSRGSLCPAAYGVTLIIGPWNYPIQLLLAPLVSALAAGNCALLKPSELTPHCSELLSQLLPRYLDDNVVSIVSGGVETSTELLAMKWDLIFFTGSTEVGKIVASAAAKHVTPTILELGGKSPCFVDVSADLKVTARRILWGKLLNAGQTCVAPDYLLVSRPIAEELLSALKSTLQEFFPNGFQRAENYCGIINERHFERLRKIADAHSNELRCGGNIHPHNRTIEPSFYMLDIASAETAPLMQEEIFGPLLPLIAVDSPQQAISFINAREHPLALYVFSSDQNVISQFEGSTRSGSLIINDTVIQLATSQLPFGGVGASGYGAYHGETGFRSFSHMRSVLRRPSRWMDIPLRYRPMLPSKLWILKKLLKFRNIPKLPSPPA